MSTGLTWRHGPVLVGTAAHNPHVQNVVRALDETQALHSYLTGGVDVFASPVARVMRRALGGLLPVVNRELGRRAIRNISEQKVRSRWRWELPRVAASRLGFDERFVDWLWEHGEFDLDRTAASMIRSDQNLGSFIGVEYGALASILEANRAGKAALLVYMSPHRRTLMRWIEAEYEQFPELTQRKNRYFESIAARRDARRDEELAHADRIVTNSMFTTNSLVQAGVPAHKLLTIPLGGPQPVRAADIPVQRPAVQRIIFVGNVSVLKGTHHLLRVWKSIARPGVELHLYGSMQLPERVVQEARSASGSDSIVFHGSVPASELRSAYLQSSVLVLPTLCDGFGMVVSEALAHGLPVITTRNAGAADLIEDRRNGFLINAADPNGLVDVLNWCCEHPDELFEMRQAALASAHRWTWADFRNRFVELLDGALTSMNGSARDPHLVPVRVAG